MDQEKMELMVKADPKNESFARAVVGAFVSRLNPTLEQLSDIQTAVSEAVTNCVVHAYRDGGGDIRIICEICGSKITISIADQGCGIPDLEKAREPFYTTCPEMERSGMGFTIMEAFMDSVEVTTHVNEGTTVVLKRDLSATDDDVN